MARPFAPARLVTPLGEGSADFLFPALQRGYLSDEEAYELMHILNSPNFKLRRSQRDLAERFADLIWDKLEEEN